MIDVSKIIESIKNFNKPIVFLVFGFLVYWASPFRMCGLLSIFIGIALSTQKIWEWGNEKCNKCSNIKKLKKRIDLLNVEERQIIVQMLLNKNQSSVEGNDQYVHSAAHFSLVTKGIGYFGKEISGRYYDFHITDEAWEILEKTASFTRNGGNHAS